MADITISSRVRSNLLALQNTSDLMTMTQNRLATGKKINGPLDNPTAYFQASGMSDRSKALTNLLDGINNGISTIQAASRGLDSIYKQLQALQGLISQVQAAGTGAQTVAGSATGNTQNTALTWTAPGDTVTLTDAVTHSVTTITVGATTTVGGLISAITNGSGGAYTASLDSSGKLVINSSNGNAFSAAFGSAGGIGLPTSASNSAFVGGNISNTQQSSFVAQFNTILTSIDQFAQDASFNGVNLLQNGSTLTINYNENGSSKSQINGQAADSTSLGVAALTGATANIAGITSSASSIATAMTTVKSLQSSYATTLSIAQNRQDFTKSLSNILQTGSDNLTNADMNLESANMLALQTRQQLSQTALSLSNQADQAVLRLFG